MLTAVRTYDPKLPVVCMDEKPYQLLGEKRELLPMSPGSNEKIDSEYVRNGTCSIFVFVEPLAGFRYATARYQRTAVDWAEEIHYLLTEVYPHHPKILLVMDNLNTHKLSSLYKRYPPEVARSLAERLEIHYTPKHGSWLNMAEIQLNAMTRMCLNRRIADLSFLLSELSAWSTQRNQAVRSINWQFTKEEARIKLKRLYPNYEIG